MARACGDQLPESWFLDIPEAALRNRPLAASVLGADGIWDDFEGTEGPCDFDYNSNDSFNTTTTNKSDLSVANFDSDPTMSSEDNRIFNNDDETGTFYMFNPSDILESEIPAKKRDILTPQDAKNIYLRLFQGMNERPGASVLVSQQYGVSPKTVRDIWNR